MHRFNVLITALRCMPVLYTSFLYTFAALNKARSGMHRSFASNRSRSTMKAHLTLGGSNSNSGVGGARRRSSKDATTGTATEFPIRAWASRAVVSGGKLNDSGKPCSLSSSRGASKRTRSCDATCRNRPELLVLGVADSRIAPFSAPASSSFVQLLL